MTYQARFTTTVVELVVPFVHEEGDLLLPGTRGRLMGWDSEADAQRAAAGDLERAFVLVSWQTYMFLDECSFGDAQEPYHATQFYPLDEEGYFAAVPVTSLRTIGAGPTIAPPKD